jgi:hypothetical protein
VTATELTTGKDRTCLHSLELGFPHKYVSLLLVFLRRDVFRRLSFNLGNRFVKLACLIREFKALNLHSIIHNASHIQDVILCRGGLYFFFDVKICCFVFSLA